MKKIACPECGKQHRTHNSAKKCEIDATWAYGHYVMRGDNSKDSNVLEAKARMEAFEEYQKQLRR